MTYAKRLKGNLAPADTSRGPSPNIWGDCPIMSIIEGSIPGVKLIDEFEDYPLVGTQTTQIGHGRYKVFNTGAGVVTVVTTVNSVVLGKNVLAINLDTDNDSGSIAQSYPGFMLNSTARKLWFEARIACSPITTDGIGFFLGLAETDQWTLATAVPFNGGDAIDNSASAIGFRKKEDGLGKIDTVYSDRATSFTNIKEDATEVTAAFEWIKLGMKFDPTLAADKRITFYANNLELPDRMTSAALAALTNLKAQALGPILAMIADSGGTSGLMYMDWWRTVQIG